jgi:6,7-dimethyl-8-ribityllumazine synthase
MIKSLHIGRFVARPAEFRGLAEFLTAIGFERLPEAAGKAAAFSAPGGIISLNRPSGEHPRRVLQRLKDVEKLIVLEVTNPDDIFGIAQKRKLKILGDSAEPGSSERTFWLELPGGIVAAVHGAPAPLESAIEGKLDARGKRFAIVVSRFNSFITERLLQGALDGLLRSGAERGDVDVVRVPGSFEIPAAARTLAERQKYDAMICLGCVLRGETAHYDVIVNEVARGVGQSAQETGVPHAFGVLTCDTLEQAIDRAGLKMGNKGFEAALAAVEMANLEAAAGGRTSVVGKTATAGSRTHSSRRKPPRPKSRQ